MAQQGPILAEACSIVIAYQNLLAVLCSAVVPGIGPPNVFSFGWIFYHHATIAAHKFVERISNPGAVCPNIAQQPATNHSVRRFGTLTRMLRRPFVFLEHDFSQFHSGTEIKKDAAREMVDSVWCLQRFLYRISMAIQMERPHGLAIIRTMFLFHNILQLEDSPLHLMLPFDEDHFGLFLESYQA